MGKKKKIIMISVFVCIILVMVSLTFILKGNKKNFNKNSNSNETNTNTNTSINIVNTNDITIIAEAAFIQKQYGDYFELEVNDEFSIIDMDGKEVVKNPLFLAYAIASSRPVYQGKDLAVHATYDSPKPYKIYKSTENASMGYVAVTNDTLDNIDSIQNYYLGKDLLLSIATNPKTEENLVIKYNYKTGEVLASKIIDGNLSITSWNGAIYLVQGHANFIETEKFTKLFQKEYILGDKVYDSEGDDFYTASNKYMTAKYNGKYGVIDANEKTIIPFNYLLVEQIPNRDIIKVKTSSGYGLLNNRNQVLLDATYDSIEVYDNYTVVVDQNGILRILNNKYETLFTGTKKMKTGQLVSANAIRTSSKINKDWNILQYENMIHGEEKSTYYVIFGVNNGKIKEFLNCVESETVYNSPTNYGYTLLRTDSDIIIYDGIVERSKANISEYPMADIMNVIYINDTYITFEEGDGKSLSTRYFINMKTNKIETQAEAKISEEDIPKYNTILDSKRIVRYENNRVNLYDFQNNLLVSMIGTAIHKMEGLTGNFYEITDGDTVSIIRINQK